MRKAILLLCASLAHATIPLGYTGGATSVARGGSISATDPTFNGGDPSVCTGSSHDDRPPIQTTLNYASANGIPIVTIPATTCYMNSYANVGGVMGNLQIPNGVTLQGTTGSSRILETSLGRPTCTSLCTVTVINIGTFAVTWSKMGCPPGRGRLQIFFANASAGCTGYHPLNTPTVGSNIVTLTNSFDSSRFHIGDYITIYDHQPQATDDVINGFQSTVTNVSGATITLADRMARSSPTSYIGNLSTGLSQGIVHIGHDIGLKGVIVQGPCTMVMTESFNVTLQNDQFITDTGLYDSTHQYIAVGQWNSMVHYTFDSNQFISIGTNGNSWSAEMTQRDSGFGSWTNNTFGVAGAAGFNSYGLSEFSHDITFTGNHVFTNAVSFQACGFNFAAQNATISNNDFHTSGSWSSAGGGFICDVLGLPDVYPSYGNIAYSGNTITCNASGTPCVALQALQGLTFTGNTITVPPGSNSLYGILLQYYPSNDQINNNQINVQGGYGIYAQPPSDSGWTINGNTVTAVSGVTGISVGPASNPGGPCSVQNNTSSSGFSTAVSGDPTNRNCTVGNNH
jgi:hypothetical protein